MFFHLSRGNISKHTEKAWPLNKKGKTMKNIMEYNGYRAMIEYDEDDELFVGTVIGINDSISFHGQNTQELKQHFKHNVDNYVDMCRQFGKNPEKRI